MFFTNKINFGNLGNFVAVNRTLKVVYLLRKTLNFERVISKHFSSNKHDVVTR
jgi:hypothetical protein